MRDRLNYRTTGDPKRPALLLVHGFLSSNAQWQPNLDLLGERFFVVLAELWGHGDSPLPADDSAFTIPRYVAEFEHIRNELNLGCWGVVGQSYAAGLAINYAIAHPERVTGLAVTNSRSAFGDIATARKEKARRNQIAASTLTEKQKNNRHMPIHPIYAKRLPADVKARLVACADNMTEEAINKGGLIRRALNSESLIDSITPPFMIANGVYEKSFQVDLSRLKTGRPGLKVVDMQGGHAVNIEAADEFSATMIQFFLNP